MEINFIEIFVQIINFLLLFFLLRIFAWKKILFFLDARKERIASQIKEADEALCCAAATREKLDTQLAAIDELTKIKIQEAVAEGRKLTEDIRKKAHQDAQDIITIARESIQYEIAKARDELKEKIVNLTIETAESVIEEKLSEETDKKLVKSFLDKMDSIE
jgi:F-type H+-transporting ATPase subunit b